MSQEGTFIDDFSHLGYAGALEAAAANRHPDDDDDHADRMREQREHDDFVCGGVNLGLRVS